MRIGLICCAALAGDVRRIARRRGWNAQVITVPAQDHLFPARIAPDVERRIRAHGGRFDRLAVVYGECGTNGALDEVLGHYGLRRPEVENCYQMYAGPLYRELLDEELGTFFLTDFLVRTFRRAVIEGLGLDRFPELKEEYFHNCRRVVYLAQRRSRRLVAEAEAIAAFMERPLEVRYTGTVHLERAIDELVFLEEHRFGLPPYRTTCAGRSVLGGMLFG